MSHKVFICHSAKDNAEADQVCAALEAEGMKCWIAPRDVRAGAVWAEAITDAIDKAKVMVILISADTIRTQHQVIREIELADSRNTALLPLFIEKVTLSKGLEFYLRNRQWIDASSPPLESHMPRVVGAVRDLLTGETVPPPPPPPPPQPKTWRWLVIGTAALLLVAVGIMAYKRDFFFGGENVVVKDSNPASTPALTPTHTARPTLAPSSNDNKPSAVPTVTVTPTVAPTLEPPETLEPRCDTTFALSNPTLGFSWSRVAGASTYTLEWDCFRCSSHPSGWYSQLGRPWMIKEGVGLRSPIYTTQDVYNRLRRERALAFRWRIWAVDSNLVNGKKSAWCQLAFAGRAAR